MRLEGDAALGSEVVRRSNRVDLPECVRRAFLWATPEPDTVFFLDCDATTILGRKRELTLGEIERQLGAYRELASRSRRFVTLDLEKETVAAKIPFGKISHGRLEVEFPKKAKAE